MNDSLIKTTFVMFFEISRCLNALFANELMKKLTNELLMNSMFCNSSNDVKNSSFDLNSISLVSSIVDEIKVKLKSSNTESHFRRLNHR